MLNKEIRKQVKEFQKKLLEQEAQKEMVLSHNMDWAFLEEMVKKINENPFLKIEVVLKDGTKLNLQTFRPPKATDSIESLDIQ